ncbi:MAG: A/G-specific adenine glycosylase [Hyphomicrobiales bacterium]|nr:A/G-specific adenine glycosylase [Hyphomicrobiales bacterium]
MGIEAATAHSLSADRERPGFAPALLAWYDRERRDFPWRAKPGVAADPYRVWLSEIMLQQTTTKAAIPYFNAFTARWPQVEALAAAPREEIMAAWAGLGYYARARNMHACAKAVMERHGGAFPRDEAALRALPGVGAYTAAAVAAIAFDAPATVVDGNVERVVARLFAVETPLPEAKSEIRRLAADLTPALRPGDYAQAMMDLGATVCTPRSPSCLVCPVEAFCAAHKLRIQNDLPRRSAKSARPLRRGAAFVAVTEDGYVLLRRRAETGLLAGMMEAPSTPWTEAGPADGHIEAHAPVDGVWLKMPGGVSHTFTHFQLELDVYRAHAPRDTQLRLAASPEQCRWVRRAEVAGEALPTVMRKVLSLALEQPLAPRRPAKRTILTE